MTANTTVAIALNRFGLGVRPGEPLPEDPRAWLLNQFDHYDPRPAAWAALPSSVSLLAGYRDHQRAVRTASADGAQAARQTLRSGLRDDYQFAVNARLASAVETPTPFIERLVHFWSNHFALSVEKPQVLAIAGAYEVEAIRPHVLGRFEDMLLAVERHPAMLAFLDQTQSIGPDSRAAQRLAARDPERKRGLNENLAREIMELHTLGVRSGYTQADVTEFARALTGWSIVAAGDPDAGRFVFRPNVHEPGARLVLGRRYEDDGEGQAAAILRDLASALATGRHIATQLARHFIADDPPPELVQQLTDAFVRSRGDLPTVYRVLIDAPQAWRAPSAKFKSPWDWTVSSLRALGGSELQGAQGAQLLQQLGQPVWRPGSPAGYDDIAATWAAPDALVRRVEMAQRFAARVAGRVDPRALAPQLLPGDALSSATAAAIARAESPATGLALLLVSPEFLRR